jgi:polar amino acid transport system substrate-binding protein
MQRADPRVADLVRSGRIRVALFLPQYSKDAASGALKGVGTGVIAIEIAHVLAARLDIAAALIGRPTPKMAVACLKNDGCDVAFLGIEPSRTAEVGFSAAIFQFDYTLLVPAGSLIHGVADADRPGTRIAVVDGHASALALQRMVTHAELVGVELPDDGFELLRAGKVAAFALPRQQLVDYARKLPGARALDDSYGVNRVAMAVRKDRSEWLAYLNEFIEDAKASGLIQRVIDNGALHGFAIAAR